MTARIVYKDGCYEILAPYDIGPRLQPSLKLDDGSRVTMYGCSRDADDERRVVYRWFIDDELGHELATADDIRSGAHSDVDVESAFQTLASFLGAWVEAQGYPSSENRDLFPKRLLTWADHHHEELFMLVHQDELEQEESQ